jgi:MarC family integral membrane protein
VIVLASQARNPAETFVVYGAIVVTGIISFVVLRLGEPLLGKTGIRVVTRIMGLILAAICRPVCSERDPRSFWDLNQYRNAPETVTSPSTPPRRYNCRPNPQS